MRRRVDAAVARPEDCPLLGACPSMEAPEAERVRWLEELDVWCEEHGVDPVAVVALIPDEPFDPYTTGEGHD